MANWLFLLFVFFWIDIFEKDSIWCFLTDKSKPEMYLILSRLRVLIWTVSEC